MSAWSSWVTSRQVWLYKTVEVLFFYLFRFFHPSSIVTYIFIITSILIFNNHPTWKGLNVLSAQKTFDAITLPFSVTPAVTGLTDLAPKSADMTVPRTKPVPTAPAQQPHLSSNRQLLYPKPHPVPKTPTNCQPPNK